MQLNDTTRPILFFDGHCGLCRREIALLRPRLADKMVLKNLHDADFQQFQGVSKQQMWLQLHLWDGQKFLTGIDASLYYWELAGYRRTVRLLRLPPFYMLSRFGYRCWTRWRENNHQCRLSQ